jgi:pimeloyl-ACP methyl ester carboxylesterase
MAGKSRLLGLYLALEIVASLQRPNLGYSSPRSSSNSKSNTAGRAVSCWSKEASFDETADVVIIGAGIGGLSAAALLARYGKRVIVVEAHDTPGGCAHGFERRSKNGAKYKFDAGPSLWAGMSTPSTNPLRQVFERFFARMEKRNSIFQQYTINDYCGAFLL